MTNWKNLVETSQAKTFVLPDGWDTREAVATELGCSAARVRTLLEPSIKNKTVEVRAFPIYDAVIKRVVRVTAYRKVPKVEAAAGAKPGRRH